MEKLVKVEQIEIGKRIKAGQHSTLVVTKIDNQRAYGYLEERFLKKGIKEDISMRFSMITSPYYSRDLFIY